MQREEGDTRDLEVDQSIILKWVLEKEDLKCGLNLNGSQWRTSAYMIMNFSILT
jgi:hypothetical protein